MKRMAAIAAVSTIVLRLAACDPDTGAGSGGSAVGKYDIGFEVEWPEGQGKPASILWDAAPHGGRANQVDPPWVHDTKWDGGEAHLHAEWYGKGELRCAIFLNHREVSRKRSFNGVVDCSVSTEVKPA